MSDGYNVPDFGPMDGIAPTEVPHSGGGAARLAKLIRGWELGRQRDTKGYKLYGSVFRIDAWGTEAGDGISCSPFTAQAIAYAFDRNDEPGENVDPVWDGGKKTLPSAFYTIHNGNFGGNKHLKYANGQYTGTPSGSCVLYNLARFVPANEIRRGDVIAIDGHHAGFVWDVHLGKDGKVDSFQFMSATGNYKREKKPDDTYLYKGSKGPGIVVDGARDMTLKNAGGDTYWLKSFQPAGYKAPSYGVKLAGNVFDDAHDYRTKATWFRIKLGKPSAKYMTAEGKTEETEIDKTTHPAPKNVGKKARWIIAARLHGVTPPEPTPDGAPAVAAPAHATSVAPIEVRDTPPAGTNGTARPAAPPPTTPPTPVAQDPAAPTEGQKWAEERLQMLWKIRYLESDPGKPDDINDEKSQAAFKEFQEKNPPLKATGIPDGKTKKKLKEVVAAQRKGMGAAAFDAAVAAAERMPAPAAAPPPADAPVPPAAAAPPPATPAATPSPAATPPATPAATPAAGPAIAHVYWATGSAAPGEKEDLFVHATGLDGTALEIALEDTSGTALAAPTIAPAAPKVKGGKAKVTITIPALPAGAAPAAGEAAPGIRAKVTAGTASARTEAPLYLEDEDGSWHDYSPEYGTPEKKGKPLPAKIAARVLAWRKAVVDPCKRAVEADGKPMKPLQWISADRGGWSFIAGVKPRSALRKYVIEKLEARLAATDPDKDRKRWFALKTFVHLQQEEGTTCDLGAWDGQCVTWGSGFGGNGSLGELLSHATKNETIRRLFHECGFRWTGKSRENEFECVKLDVDASGAATGGKVVFAVSKSKTINPALEVMRGTSKTPELMYMLMLAAYGLSEKVEARGADGAVLGSIGPDIRRATRAAMRTGRRTSAARATSRPTTSRRSPSTSSSRTSSTGCRGTSRTTARTRSTSPGSRRGSPRAASRPT